MSTCSDPLPDFTHFSYIIVIPPDQARGQGWDKLKECERRLALYRWAEQINYPGRTPHNLPLPRHRVFLDDCVSAFLMTYEAALQFTGDQLQKRKIIPHRGLNQWLRSLPEYDLQMKGLRTLRHLAAHKEIKPVSRTAIITLEKDEEIRPGWRQITESTISPIWVLPELTTDDLDTLDSPELDPIPPRTRKNPRVMSSLIDLPAWNSLVTNPHNDAPSILEHGLRQAQAILLTAEKLL